MTPLTYEQALGMLRRQEVDNSQLDAAWREKQHPFLRAAWIETATFVEGMGWKWWEAKHPDLGATDVSLCIIWGHMLSEWLQNVPPDEGLEDAAALLIDVMYSDEKGGAAQNAKLQNYKDVMQLADTFAHLCTANTFNANVFERMMELSTMTWDGMHKLTLGE